MKIEYLYEFFRLSKFGNFSRAADELYMSQSSLSRHIIQMEEELGVLLLRRSSKSVELTDAGQILCESLETILREYDLAVSRMVQLGDREDRKLRIGLPSVPTNDYLGDTILEFNRKYPNVECIATFAHPEQNIAALLKGELDIIHIARIPFPNYELLKFHNIKQEDLILVANENDPVVQKPTVVLEELEGLKFIGNNTAYFKVIWDRVAMLCSWKGIAINLSRTYDGMDQLLNAARQNKGVLIIGEHHKSMVMNGLAYAHIKDPGTVRDISFAHRVYDTNPLLAEFVNCYKRTH